ncbi:uncharacterized protein [Palaemon carinicauda]|uniref:uncharacterized protein n=1 Tax=Palaemon carinicauda TaxID=392227 RepID=UPI0035B5C96A
MDSKEIIKLCRFICVVQRILANKETSDSHSILMDENVRREMLVTFGVTVDDGELEHQRKDLSEPDIAGNKINNSGKRVVEVFNENDNLVLITPKGLPTRLNPITGTFSTIYLCFSSSTIANYFNIKELADRGSKHTPILTYCDLETEQTGLWKRKRWVLEDVNWQKWNNDIDAIEMANKLELDCEIQDFSNRIIKSSEKNIRQTNEKSQREMIEWVEIAKHNNEFQDYNKLYSMAELEECIKELPNESATGLDKIHDKFIKNMSKGKHHQVLGFINKIWRVTGYPKMWKQNMIWPVLKLGKPEELPESYRPIALLSCFGRLMERMVHKRLYWMLENKEQLGKNQSGLRKTRSTTDQLVRLEHEIKVH